MKAFFTKFVAVLLAISLTTAAFGQSIGGIPGSNPVVVSSPVTSCTNTTVTVDVTQLCFNYIYNGPSFAISGDTITVSIDWDIPGPICLGALAFLQPTQDLGQLPAGTYTLVIQTRLNNVVQQSVNQPLNVISCCTAQALISASTTNICAGDSVLFVNTSVNAASFFWSQNGSSFSTSDSVIVHFPTGGTFPIELTATGTACLDNTFETITVSDYPNINLGPDTSVCVGSSLLLNGTSPIGGVDYMWSTGDTTPTITVTNTGTYSLTIDNNGCSSDDAVTVSSSISPIIDLGTDTILCEGSPLILNATTNQPGATYIWATGQTTPTFSVVAGGVYNVTVTNGSNCSSTDNISVNIETVPTPNLGADTTLCQGATLVLNGFSAPATSFLWSTGATSVTIGVNTAGTYSVTSTTNNGCSGTDDIVVNYSTLSVNLGDSIGLLANQVVTLDAGNAGATYLWNTGATTQTIDTDSVGTYTVTVTDASNCSATSSVVIVMRTTGTESLSLEQIQVFPNPAHDHIIIESNTLNLQSAVIFNSVGQVVKQAVIQNNSQIAVQDLSSGLYFIHLKNTDGAVIGTTRFIKQ